MMKKTWTLKKTEDGVSPVIATILMVAITVVLAAVLYVMVLGLTGTGTNAPPVFGMNVGGDSNNYTWTVTAISGARSVLKSDIYVQLSNSTGFVITTELLSTASGTHGFKYISGSTGDYAGVGDKLSLSRSYGQGTTLNLVTPSGTGQYAALTI